MNEEMKMNKYNHKIRMEFNIGDINEENNYWVTTTDQKCFDELRTQLFSVCECIIELLDLWICE